MFIEGSAASQIIITIQAIKIDRNKLHGAESLFAYLEVVEHTVYRE